MSEGEIYEGLANFSGRPKLLLAKDFANNPAKVHFVRGTARP